jgi:hypothetical protein
MPVATIATIALAAIVAVVGGVVTIVHPETLSFDQYVQALEGVVIGTGLLGIGRGVHAASKAAHVDPVVEPDVEDLEAASLGTKALSAPAVVAPVKATRSRKKAV